MIAIIPARAGSKGLPNKNILPMNGKPLISYTIEAALASNLITDVFVSTDSEEYAKIAIEYGAKVPFLRPQALSDDNASAKDVYQYVIDKLTTDHSYTIKDFIVLQPTSPLRSTSDINDAIKMFYDKNADSVISVSKAITPITWYKKLSKLGKISGYQSNDISMKNRQDEEVAYIPNGAIYVFNKVFFSASDTYYSDNTYAYIMPIERSVDVDVELEFKFAEFLMTRN